MTRSAIADSSCLISLGNANILSLLSQTFEEVYTTNIIASEVGSVPSWIRIVPCKIPFPLSYFGIDLDPGEASAIAVASEINHAVLILDDLKARRVAMRLSRPFVGTLGVAIQAKKTGVIQSIQPIIIKLKEAGLYFSIDVEMDALREAGEA